MWLHFYTSHIDRHDVSYPIAIKIAAGKINTITGEEWKPALNQEPQDYVVVPRQPWLDGYCVEKGYIRQFVAMPLGAGYTAEEQLTGQAVHGGLQIIAYPMKRQAFKKRFPRTNIRSISLFCLNSEMGLAPGGRMRQEIYEDPYDFDD